MSVSRLRDKRRKEKRPGFYVAVVRNTGVAHVMSADTYHRNGEEFEKGKFFNDFREAAVACDIVNDKIDQELASGTFEEAEMIVEAVSTVDKYEADIEAVLSTSKTDEVVKVAEEKTVKDESDPAPAKETKASTNKGAKK